MSNWIVRFTDDNDAPDDEVKTAVRRALTELGYRVHNINHPMQLNPEPLRVRKDD